VFLYRRETIENIHWNPALQYHQDKDFAVRVASTSPWVVSLDQIVGIWNDHDGHRIKTDVKSGTEYPEIVRRRLRTIEMGLRRLEERDALRPYHCRTAARGIWRSAHKVAAFDLRCFQECNRVVRRLDEQFTPSRSSTILEILDRVWGASSTEHILYPFRRMKQRLSG
jgi:hypothetical protein